MFIVDSTQPGLTLIEVGLITGRAAVFQTLRPKLDPRVGIGNAADAKFERQVEVSDGPLPEEEFIVVESSSGGDLGSDRSILDAPESGVAGPALERCAVEKGPGGLLCGGREAREERQERCEQDREFPGHERISGFDAWERKRS